MMKIISKSDLDSFSACALGMYYVVSGRWMYCSLEAARVDHGVNQVMFWIAKQI